MNVICSCAYKIETVQKYRDNLLLYIIRNRHWPISTKLPLRPETFFFANRKQRFFHSIQKTRFSNASSAQTRLTTIAHRPSAAFGQTLSFNRPQLVCSCVSSVPSTTSTPPNSPRPSIVHTSSSIRRRKRAGIKRSPNPRGISRSGWRHSFASIVSRPFVMFAFDMAIVPGQLSCCDTKTRGMHRTANSVKYASAELYRPPCARCSALHTRDFKD